MRHDTPDTAIADSTKRNTIVTTVPSNWKIQIAVRYNTDVKRLGCTCPRHEGMYRNWRYSSTHS